jgi:hypothetical protein
MFLKLAGTDSAENRNISKSDGHSANGNVSSITKIKQAAGDKLGGLLIEKAD